MALLPHWCKCECVWDSVLYIETKTTLLCNYSFIFFVVSLQRLFMVRVCTLRWTQTTRHIQPIPHQILQAIVGSTSARCWWDTQQLADRKWESYLQGKVQFCLIPPQIMPTILPCTSSSMIPRPIQSTWSLSSELVHRHSTWTVFADGSFVFLKLWTGARWGPKTWNE